MLKIKQLRQEKNISQHELARRIKASPKTVNFWEQGISEPSAGFIIALADEFECTTDYLLGREDEFGRVNVIRNISDSENELCEIFNSLGTTDKELLKSFALFLKKR